MAKKAKKRPIARLDHRQWLVILSWAGIENFAPIANELGIRMQVIYAMVRNLLQAADKEPRLYANGKLAYELGVRCVLPPALYEKVRAMLVKYGEACKLKDFLETKRMPHATVEEIIGMSGRNFKYGSDKRYDWKEWSALEEMARITGDSRTERDIQEKRRQAKADDSMDL